MQVPDKVSVMKVDPDANWAIPAMEEALRMCGQLRRLAEAGTLPPITLGFAVGGLTENADALREVFGGEQPTTRAQLKPILSKTFSAAAFALAVGLNLMQMHQELPAETA